MIQLGEKIPSFKLAASDTMDLNFKTISDLDYQGKWKILFFWPKDFTFVCPTEIVGFADLHQEFKKNNTQLLGCSVDSEFVHLAWKNAHPQLKDLPFPMLSDIKRELSASLGIIDQNAGVSQRATFIIDPQNVVRYIEVTDIKVGRNPTETLRILHALQTDGLVPCNWKKGEKLL